jgi:hypothetical protein
MSPAIVKFNKHINAEIMTLPGNSFNIQSVKSLSLAGISIWAFTNITYSLLSWLIISMQSDRALITYCAITVIVLSIVTILVFSDYKLSSKLSSIGKVFSYALLLYFIANGIQSMYAAIQPTYEKPATQQAELIPFLDSRPWLPPAGMRNTLSQNTITLTQLTSDNSFLTNALDSAVARLESCGLMTDSIFLTAIPITREVAKGGVFRSEVVLAARLDKSYVKKISVNDDEIQLKNGIGIFEENTGNIRQIKRDLDYIAEIELYGENQTITTSDSYKIIRPYIEVSSQTVNSLFLNCGNQLNIQVPVLGSDYRPKFKVEGGSFKYGKSVGNITVLPTSRQVEIDVYNKNSMIGKKTFPVRRIPSPSIHPFADGKAIDLDQGISKGTSSIALSVHPDPDFERLLPNDAKYMVQNCEISLLSNGMLRGKMIGNNNSNITSLTKKAKQGDQLKIEIKTVLRKNFKGDIERVINFYPKFFLVELK